MKTKKSNDEKEMQLPEGMTCGNCKHSIRCKTLFGGDDSNTSCQFLPNRFKLPPAPLQ